MVRNALSKVVARQHNMARPDTAEGVSNRLKEGETGGSSTSCRVVPAPSPSPDASELSRGAGALRSLSASQDAKS